MNQRKKALVPAYVCILVMRVPLSSASFMSQCWRKHTFPDPRYTLGMYGGISELHKGDKTLVVIARQA